MDLWIKSNKSSLWKKYFDAHGCSIFGKTGHIAIVLLSNAAWSILTVQILWKNLKTEQENTNLCSQWQCEFSHISSNQRLFDCLLNNVANFAEGYSKYSWSKDWSRTTYSNAEFLVNGLLESWPKFHFLSKNCVLVITRVVILRLLRENSFLAITRLISIFRPKKCCFEITLKKSFFDHISENIK